MRCTRSKTVLVRWIPTAILTFASCAIVADDVEEYRAFATRTPGDAGAGRKVFEGDKAKCSRCHVVGTDERKAGPNLLGIADKHPRAKLIHHILKPSTEILAGYATQVIVTNQGEAHTGIVKNRGVETLELWIATGEVIKIPTSKIASDKAARPSLMPDGLQTELMKEEFADLIAYVESLVDPNAYQHASFATPDEIQSLKKPIRLVPIHGEKLSFGHPVWLEPMPGLPDTFVVVENDPAKIWLLEISSSGTRKTLFLDLKKEIHTGQHMGLMGLAFHPSFLQNRRYFLNHHYLENGAFGTYIVERRASGDLRRDAGVPSRRLLRITQRTQLHTGGMLAFGPDDYLYIGTGDGGPQEDPEGHAQNATLLNGAILRIDVDSRDPGLEYAIPESNPHHDSADSRIRQEIWATGLRQAWRFSWDAKTQDLWVGDVGQTRFEEITLVRQGENHGWNVYEGFLPFSDRFRKKGTKYVPPIVALARKHGASVTGGYVYRGKRSKSYEGVYIFADYESRRMWGLTQKDRRLTKIREIGRAPDRVTTFAVDTDGEIYLLGYDTGMIYRVALESSVFE